MSEKTITAYKAFGPGMICRGMQFEVGKTYTHEGEIVMCESGFHACEVPFDCWSYYPASMTFARVTMTGVSDETENDSKRVAASITIEATLTLPEWIKAHADAVVALCKRAASALTSKDDEPAATTGNWANAATTGNWANAATTGEGANAATTGNWANAATTGNWANAATTGNWANAATTGKDATAACIGYDGKAKAGEGGAIVIAYFDGKRKRLALGYVGEGGIKADTWYRVRDGVLVEAEES
jgi:hypothetical protein